MQTQETVKTDLETANEKLADLRSDITPRDKQKLYGEKGLNPATVSKYLNRKGTDLDTAMYLLTFFRSCIADRRKELAKAV